MCLGLGEAVLGQGFVMVFVLIALIIYKKIFEGFPLKRRGFSHGLEPNYCVTDVIVLIIVLCIEHNNNDE